MSQQDQEFYMTEFDQFLFAKGDWFCSYEKLGAHPAKADGVEGYHFALWCPDVAGVSVIGSFNDWDQQAHPLHCNGAGVWEGFVPYVGGDDLYKYAIRTFAGQTLIKADPYAFYAQVPPDTASRVYDPTTYAWADDVWMAQRATSNHRERPLNIFEVHLASWKRHLDGLAGNGDPNSADKSGSYLSYAELSEDLVAYVKEMGYTHVELLPVMEHPFDGSWGYQITGYFAPTSRYGDPISFKKFIDACHQAGIGVILDWAGGGFCADSHGLADFNGGSLYETKVHPTWGTHLFDFGRGEVKSFLISNLMWWVGEYHADGIRMDGVTSMLYLNFDINDPAQKRYNSHGGEENEDALAFIQAANKELATAYPDVMIIAEESTAWPKVTQPPAWGGLGFHYKWDMGWMNDTLRYIQTDFPYRADNHGLITFGLAYVFDENFVLPLSHDEVVHGKGTLISRMPGDMWRKFAGLRALALLQMTHPGGKLNFMGNEIGQFDEWRYYEGIQYNLAETYPLHQQQQSFIQALNRFYLSQPALWQYAYDARGFEWVDSNNQGQSIFSWMRHGENPADDLLVIINMGVDAYDEYRLGVPAQGDYSEYFNTDSVLCGGSGVVNVGVLRTEDIPAHGKAQSLVLRVPPLGGVVLGRVKREEISE